MFPRLVRDSFRYAPPWDTQTLEDRLAALDEDLPRVAWVYERPDTSTFRYRVFNMVECLQSETPRRVAASWFSGSEIDALIPRLPELDALVLARVRYDAEVAQLIAMARAHKVTILFDCDDLVFDCRFVHLILDTLDQDTRSLAVLDSWFALCSRLESVARLCDGGIATNHQLAARMAEVVDGPVEIVPNYLNRRQQEVSDLLLAKKAARRFRGEGPVVVGYFSGSPSHNRDFAIAAPAIARLLSSDPDVRVRIAGFLDSIGPLETHAKRVERLPLDDWINLQKHVAEVEISIAPLQENVFTNCKSELKFFEAAAVGTWTIATPTPPFRASITSPGLGQLVRADEWDNALETAVLLARSGDRYAACAEHNAAHVRCLYGWDRFADRIIQATLGHG